MKRFIRKQLNKDNKLLKHTAILLSATIIANIFNYLYHLYMGRSLGPEKYAILGSLFAIVHIIMVVNNTIILVVSRFVTEYNVKKDYGRIKVLVLKSLKNTSLFGMLCFGTFALLSGWVSSFLKIDSKIPVLMLALYGFITLISPTFKGVLNGLQKFEWFGFTNVIATFSKLMLGIVLVWMGYGVEGALGAIIIAALIGLVVSLFAIRKIFANKSKSINTIHVTKYFSPVLLGTVLLMIMINIDVILVKHYFPSLEAGYYAAASMIAKIILFASSAIVNVMFPKVADFQDRKKQAGKILKPTILYTAIISLIAVATYFTAPTFVVGLLYGSNYKITNIIGLFGLAIALYSLNNVLVSYNLALKKNKFVLLLILALVIEVFAITLFHNTLLEIVKIIVAVNAMLFALLLLTVRNEFGLNNKSN